MGEESKKYYKEHAENFKSAHKKYMKEYCEIKARTTHDNRNIIQEHAKKMGESMSDFILRAITQTIKSDNRKTKR